MMPSCRCSREKSGDLTAVELARAEFLRARPGELGRRQTPPATPRDSHAKVVRPDATGVVDLSLGVAAGDPGLGDLSPLTTVHGKHTIGEQASGLNAIARLWRIQQPGPRSRPPLAYPSLVPAATPLSAAGPLDRFPGDF